MGNKHVNADKMKNSQRAQQAAARKAAQQARGAKTFRSQPHNGGSRGQSGHQRRR